MDKNNHKKDGSTGRVRGHSMLSPLKIMNQEQKAGNTLLQDHPGISFERLRPNAASTRPSLINATGRVVSESQVSTLTMTLQAASVSETTRSEAIPIKTNDHVPGDTTPGLSTDESESDEESIPMRAPSYYEEPDLRKWCSGMPTRKSYLSSDAEFLPRLRINRRNTLGDLPELDNLLAATKVDYNGHSFLPLTALTIHRLDPFFKGAKPLADMKLFECIVITQEVNGVHADHVVAAMERIGEHCKHLLVLSPIQTSELGNVFARETGNINTGNDWDAILGCFPNLNYLAFVHDVNEPVGFSRNTFHGLSAAVARRQVIRERLKGISFDGPPALLM